MHIREPLTAALQPLTTGSMQVRSALDFAGAEVSSSSEYVRAVDTLRAHLVPGCVGSDSRPQAKPQGGLRASGGCPLVLPPNERLVSVESDKGAHADAASRISSQQGTSQRELKAICVLPSRTRCATDTTLANSAGRRCSSWRALHALSSRSTSG